MIRLFILKGESFSTLLPIPDDARRYRLSETLKVILFCTLFLPEEQSG